ncbi:iron-containing alcohol dehydrogenase [Clostridiaceae bacterium]|nr:iron-containing alcohol dehydrogenase [Clostridiaceae bacterium]
MSQDYIDYKNCKEKLTELFQKRKVRSLFFVGKRWTRSLQVVDSIKLIAQKLNIEEIWFERFSSNPQYEEVAEGVSVFQKNRCQFIIAVGGGSAIDVAKCIKLFATMDSDISYLKQKIVQNPIPLLAIPTTAGTGSEATRFAVIYHNEEKRSVSHDSGLPQYVILDPHNVVSLPIYQKKVTLCDSLSHAIESYWSIHSTAMSRRLAETSIKLILDNGEGYLANQIKCCENMQKAANMAGQAINIAMTTAAHGMSYKLTTLFGIAHGHAVMLCLPEVWEYMLANSDNCVDPRGLGYLQETLLKLAGCLRKHNSYEAVEFLKDLRKLLGLDIPQTAGKERIETLVESVNIERLRNFPVRLNVDNIRLIYGKILRINNYECKGLFEGNRK